MSHCTGASVRPSRRAASGGVWLLLALCGIPASRAPADPAPWIVSEEMLVELRAGRLTQRTVLARRIRGEVLLPCRELFELLEMDADLDETGRLEVSGGRGCPRIVIDPAGPDAWAGRRPINPDDLRVEWTGTDLFVGARAAGDLLSTPVQVDLEDLAVTLEKVDHLPVGRRIARERAREAWLAQEGIRAPEVVLGREQAILRGAALTWGASTPLQRTESGPDGDYRLGLGAGLGGGSLDVEYAGAGWDADDAGRWTGSWMKAWPEERWLRQVRLGTIAGTGPHARFVRGAAVSNAPYQRRAYFGETSIVGRVPAGWDVEVWQEGHPVGFARADEHGAFDAAVPVEYGTNVVEIRAYGERGEEVWLSRALQIDRERIPFGEFEYQASWGECENGPCDRQGNLDFRWGVREALTVRTGADWFTRDIEPALFHPYAELIGAFRRSWLARAEGVADAFGAIELGYHPTPDARAGVIHTVYETDVEQPVLTPRDVRSRTQLSLFWRPDPGRPSRFLDSSLGRTDAFRWRQVRSRLGYHDRLGSVRWMADWQEVRTDGDLLDRRSVLGLTASATLRRFHTRGAFAVDARTGTLDRRGLSLGRSLGRAGRIEVSAEWFPGQSEALLGLNMSTEGFGFRSDTHGTRSPTGRYSGRAEMEGALVWNEAARRLEATPLVTPGRGGISGSAFLDTNENGVRDRDEEPLEGVRVQAGDRMVRTDREGRYSIWDLPAFEPVEVSVDLASAENPLLTPSFSLASIPVRPNGYREVNVPLSAGVEVSGRILKLEGDGSAAGIGGVPVSLRHVVTAREHVATTFHDGEFYLVSVPSGDYEVSVPRTYLERAGLRPEHPGRRYLLRASRDGSSSIDVRLVPEDAR